MHDFPLYGLAAALAAVLLLNACRSSAVPQPVTGASPTATPAPTEIRERPTATLTQYATRNASPDEGLPSGETEGIRWRDWEPATFALAQTENKPILLDLTAVWCHWCHVMDETSYSDPEVIRLVNELYISIRVDTDQRPDVQARYLMGGWPTTAFLTPDGDIITGGTYIPPERLIPLLRQASEYYAANEKDIAARVAEFRRQRAAARPQPASGIPTDTVQKALHRLAAAYDPTHGG